MPLLKIMIHHLPVPNLSLNFLIKFLLLQVIKKKKKKKYQPVLCGKISKVNLQLIILIFQKY
jgi:hypothetical protein